MTTTCKPPPPLKLRCFGLVFRIRFQTISTTTTTTTPRSIIGHSFLSRYDNVQLCSRAFAFSQVFVLFSKKLDRAWFMIHALSFFIFPYFPLSPSLSFSLATVKQPRFCG